jgi:hypothetical protein
MTPCRERRRRAAHSAPLRHRGVASRYSIVHNRRRRAGRAPLADAVMSRRIVLLRNPESSTPRSNAPGEAKLRQGSNSMSRQIGAIGRSESIAEFCASEGISRSYYYLLRRRGRGPREMRDGALIRITPPAHLDWRLAREAWSKSEAAKLERARRSAQARAARAARSSLRASTEPNA